MSSLRLMQNEVYMLLLRLAAHLPLRIAYAIARWLGSMRHRLLRSSLDVNADLRRELDAPPEQLDAWVRRSSELAASDILDSHVCARLRPGSMGRLLRLEGLEHLEGAVARGKGAVLSSLHIHGVMTFIAALSERGHPVTLVGRGFPLPGNSQGRFERGERRRSELLKRYGCSFIPMTPGDVDTAVKAANVLRRNGVLLMLIDTPHRVTAAEVDWLGTRAHFSSGPVFVASEMGAPLLDFFVYRDEQWWPEVAVIGPAMDTSAAPDEALQRCVTRLEAHVRRHPAQWRLFATYDDPMRVVQVGGIRVPLGIVEAELATHPGIREAVVIGVADEELGTRIKAVVVPSEPDALDENGIRDYCASRLPSYMVPTEIELG